MTVWLVSDPAFFPRGDVRMDASDKESPPEWHARSVVSLRSIVPPDLNQMRQIEDKADKRPESGAFGNLMHDPRHPDLPCSSSNVSTMYA
jgi:hypothetical protein